MVYNGFILLKYLMSLVINLINNRYIVLISIYVKM